MRLRGTEGYKLNSIKEYYITLRSWWVVINKSWWCWLFGVLFLGCAIRFVLPGVPQQLQNEGWVSHIVEIQNILCFLFGIYVKSISRRCCGTFRIFLPLRFYMKSIMNFWELLTFLSVKHFQKSKFKALKIVKKQFLTFWDKPKLISRKIRVAG